MSKNFLITGAARGIGRGLSHTLLQKGHRVFLVDNNDIEIEHMRQKLPKLLPLMEESWQIYRADLSIPSDIRLAADSASDFFGGRLDVLINNAAHTAGVGGAPFAELELEMWNKSIATNLTGSMLMSQACLPMLQNNTDSNVSGSIIMISSTRAHQSEPNSEPYAASKAGLIGLTHALASSLSEAKSPNVSVNAILPGWIAVSHESKEGDDKGLKWDDELSEDDHKWHYTGRVGKVEDILKAVEYLVEAKDFVTGTEIVIDGGVSRKMVYPE